MDTNVTLRKYYRQYVSISGILAAATGLGPLLSAWLPAVPSAYLFPPLGEATWPARLGLVILAGAVTFIAFFCHGVTGRRLMSFLFVVSFLGLCCYLISYNSFVRKIDIPSAKSEIYASVGYQRTPFAVKTFGDAGDWDLLRARGIDEEEISRLWTERSLCIARLCLFCSLALFVLPLVMVFSLGVRSEVCGTRSHSRLAGA